MTQIADEFNGRWFPVRKMSARVIMVAAGVSRLMVDGLIVHVYGLPSDAGVTVLGALLGSAITGIVTFFVTGRSIRAAEKAGEAQRAHDRDMARRELEQKRREVTYLDHRRKRTIDSSRRD